MKTILLAVLAAAAAFAQPVTITGQITNAAGDRLSGTCHITPSTTFLASDGSLVTPETTLSVKFVSGAFAVALEPTTNATPSTASYVMSCEAPLQSSTGLDAKPHTTSGSWGPWALVVSPSTISLGAAIVPTAPDPSWWLKAANLKGGGSPGAYCAVVSSDGYLTLAQSGCPDGGGSSGLSGSATWAQIEAGTPGTGSITGSTTWAQIEAQ